MRYLTSAIILVALATQSAAQDTPFSRWSTLCEGVEHTAGLALGDLDRDGDLDLITANGRHLNEVDWVYTNDGKGMFYGKRVLGTDPDPSYGIALGDVDNDGDLDALIANDGLARSYIYRNDGKGNFSRIAGLGESGRAHPRRALAVGDLDGDGDVDTVLVGQGQDHIYLNDGTGTRWIERELGSQELGKESWATGVALADLDGDKDLDVVVPGRYDTPSFIYVNDGKAGFAERRTFGSAQDDMTAVAIGDLDRDGDLEIVTAHWEQPHAVYMNDGRAAFDESRTFGGVNEQTWTIQLGDVDLDGDLDVVVGNANVGRWTENLDGKPGPERWGHQKRTVPSRVYMNDGTAAFTRHVTFGTGHDDTRPIALGDLDRDGDLDIVMGNDCQSTHVFFNSIR